MSALSIEQLVQQGIVATREGKHGLAQQLLREAVRRAPDNEQAWLWLSGVEAGDQAKIAALQQVLRINPANAAAQRGLALLTKPKELDFASIIGATTAPPPAKAAGMPAPARAAFTPAPAAAAPPMQPPVHAAPPTMPEPSLPAIATVLPLDEPATNDDHVSADVVDQLRPAIEKSKKRRVLPSVAEMVMIGVLLLLLVGAVLLLPNMFRTSFGTLRTIPSRNNGNPNQQSNNPPVVQQTQPTNEPVAVAPTKAPVASGVGGTYESRAYTLQVIDVNIDPNGSVSVNVSLLNPSSRQLFARTTDFALSSGGSRLTLDKQRSTLFDSQGRATLDAGASVSGVMVWTGNVSQQGTKLVWQPANGGVNISVPLQ